MLVIVVHGSGIVCKVLCPQHPGVSQRVILVENAFREAASQPRIISRLYIFTTRLPLSSIREAYLSRSGFRPAPGCCYGPPVLFSCCAPVSGSSRSPPCPRLFLLRGPAFFVHIRCNPVVAVDKNPIHSPDARG